MRIFRKGNNSRISNIHNILYISHVASFFKRDNLKVLFSRSVRVLFGCKHLVGYRLHAEVGFFHVQTKYVTSPPRAAIEIIKIITNITGPECSGERLSCGFMGVSTKSRLRSC